MNKYMKDNQDCYNNLAVVIVSLGNNYFRKTKNLNCYIFLAKV